MKPAIVGRLCDNTVPQLTLTGTDLQNGNVLWRRNVGYDMSQNAVSLPAVGLEPVLLGDYSNPVTIDMRDGSDRWDAGSRFAAAESTNWRLFVTDNSSVSADR